MKKILLFVISLLGLIQLNAQGLKGVELGDSGLKSPMFGNYEIETTLLGCNGNLSVEKYNNRIYYILFAFKNYSDFTEEMADNLAKSLMNKYPFLKLEKQGTDWIDVNKKVEIIRFRNAFSKEFNMAYVIIKDHLIYEKVEKEKENKRNSDF